MYSLTVCDHIMIAHSFHGAEFGPAPEPKAGQKKGRAPIIPDSFHVMVVGK